MAEKEKDLNPAEKTEVLQESISKTEVLLEENKNLISYVLVGIITVIGAYFVYNNWVVEPAEKAGFESVWPAQKYFEQDSIQKAIEEFDYVASEHSGTKAGNLANLYLGLSLLKDGQFEEALISFEEFDAKGELFPGLKVGLIADCHSELDNVDEAVANYKKAAKLLDAKSVSPYYLKKAGILLEQNNDLDGAIAIYQSAIKTYLEDAPPSLNSIKNEMKKLLARANASQ